MRRFAILICLGLLSACGTPGNSQHAVKQKSELLLPTSIYLVRHAEKDLTQAQDPPLTEQGKRRAERLVDILKHDSIQAVYSTNTQRTRDTALPVAKHNELDIQLYKVGDLNRNDLVHKHGGASILIVGHSNTIPNLVNSLIGEDKYADLSELEYDDVFLVQFTANTHTVKRFSIPLSLP